MSIEITLQTKGGDFDRVELAVSGQGNLLLTCTKDGGRNEHKFTLDPLHVVMAAKMLFPDKPFP